MTKQQALHLKAVESAVNDENVEKLRMLAVKGGLINNEYRKKSWLLFLKNGNNNNGQKSEQDFTQTKQQVELDVNRSFNIYKVNGDVEKLKKELLELIVMVLKVNPQLCYYQGYHDVAQVALLVYGSATNAFEFLNILSRSVLRDYMMPKLRPSLDQLDIIPPLLTLADPYLGKLVRSIPSFYALSSIMTLFSHNVQEFDSLCILFDYILASEKPVKSVLYLYVALILERKSKVKEVMDDVDMIHSILSNIADDPLEDVQIIVKHAIKLSENYKLDKLTTRISEYSALKQSNVSIETITKQAEQAELMNDFDTPPAQPSAKNQQSIIQSSKMSPMVVGLSVVIGVASVLFIYQDRLRSP